MGKGPTRARDGGDMGLGLASPLGSRQVGGGTNDTLLALLAKDSPLPSPSSAAALPLLAEGISGSGGASYSFPVPDGGLWVFDVQAAFTGGGDLVGFAFLTADGSELARVTTGVAEPGTMRGSLIEAFTGGGGSVGFELLGSPPLADESISVEAWQIGRFT